MLLNGLDCPFGFEASQELFNPLPDQQAKWPGLPVQG